MVRASLPGAGTDGGHRDVRRARIDPRATGSDAHRPSGERRSGSGGAGGSRIEGARRPDETRDGPTEGGRDLRRAIDPRPGAERLRTRRPDHRRAARHAGRRHRRSRSRTRRHGATLGCGARALPSSPDRITAAEAWRTFPASMGPRSAPVAAGRNRARFRGEDFSCGPSGRVHETQNCPGPLEKSPGRHQRNPSTQSRQTDATKASSRAEKPRAPETDAPLGNVFRVASHRRAKAMSWEQAEIRELKVNRYIVIDDEPCRIISIQTSKPGKHGEAKARLEAVGIFDGQKRSIVHPVTHKVRVPIIDKRKAQVLSTHGNVAQLMDLATYGTFELSVPEEFQGKLASGQEIMYIEALGRRKLSSN